MNVNGKNEEGIIKQAAAYIEFSAYLFVGRNKTIYFIYFVDVIFQCDIFK